MMIVSPQNVLLLPMGKPARPDRVDLPRIFFYWRTVQLENVQAETSGALVALAETEVWIPWLAKLLGI